MSTRKILSWQYSMTFQDFLCFLFFQSMILSWQYYYTLRNKQERADTRPTPINLYQRHDAMCEYVFFENLVQLLLYILDFVEQNLQ